MPLFLLLPLLLLFPFPLPLLFPPPPELLPLLLLEPPLPLPEPPLLPELSPLPELGFCGPLALLKEATAPVADGAGLPGWAIAGGSIWGPPLEGADASVLPLLMYAATKGDRHLPRAS